MRSLPPSFSYRSSSTGCAWVSSANANSFRGCSFLNIWLHRSCKCSGAFKMEDFSPSRSLSACAARSSVSPDSGPSTIPMRSAFSASVRIFRTCSISCICIIVTNRALFRLYRKTARFGVSIPFYSPISSTFTFV